jgi:hypothetical protein
MTGVRRYNRSRDVNWSQEVQSKSESAFRVGIYDRSHIFRLESHLPTGVGHTTKVAHTTRDVIYLHYKHI